MKYRLKYDNGKTWWMSTILYDDIIWANMIAKQMRESFDYVIEIVPVEPHLKVVRHLKAV